LTDCLHFGLNGGQQLVSLSAEQLLIGGQRVVKCLHFIDVIIIQMISEDNQCLHCLQVFGQQLALSLMAFVAIAGGQHLWPQF
jgi:hypothetical protein